MKIIMIGGKARSGKDTFASFLANNMNSKVCILQISSYIKYYAIKYFGWDGEEETKPRDLLNKIGTEIIRDKIDPDFHINRLIEDIKVLSYFYDTCIVSDVRFPSEIEKVKNEFSSCVSVKLVRDSSVLTELQKNHVSETALDDYDKFDFIIDNNGTLEELEEKAILLLKEIGD